MKHIFSAFSRSKAAGTLPETFNRNLLFIFLGESNSGGQALNSDCPPSELLPRNLKILNNTSLSFEKLVLGTNNLIGHTGLDGQQMHGLENQMANRYDVGDFGDREVFLVKSGQGGSVLSEWTSSGAYFTALINRITTAKNTLGTAKPLDIEVMLSIGINDKVNSTTVEAYKSGLQDLINRVRTTMSLPNLKFNLMSFEFVGGLDMTEYNKAIAETTVEMTNVKKFYTIGFQRDNNYHLGRAGMISASDEMLKAMI